MAIHIVSTAEELETAIAAAVGGDTILLAPGDYGTLDLRANAQPHLAFAETVTIRSLDADDPARISRLDMRDAANITLDGLHFDYVYAEGDPTYYRPFAISGSQGITVSNSIFDGDLVASDPDTTQSFGYGIGLSVRGSEDVEVNGNEFFNFDRAASFRESTNVEVTGNDIHDIRLDGLVFAQMTDVLIAENRIRDFRGDPDGGDHSDMIQFWTRNTDAPSSGIVIRDNHLDIGLGTPTHSIFMRNDQVDQGLAGEEMFFRDVEITGNTIVNGHLHGIAIGETLGLSITQNTVLRSDGGFPDGADDSVEVPRISVAAASRDVAITGNVTGGLLTNDTENPWTVSGNVIVQDQDPQAAGYYGDVFVTSSLSYGPDGHGFIAVPGGAIDTSDAGAAALQPEANSLLGHFRVVRDSDVPQLYHFSSVVAPETVLDGDSFTWVFSDGRMATGPEVTRYFPDGGTVEAQLIVTDAGGGTVSKIAVIEIAANTVLTLDPEDGLTAFDAGEAIILDPDDPNADDGIVLAASGRSETVAREHVVDILGADAFDIDFSLTALTEDTTGDIFRLHSSLLVQVDRDGDVVVRAWSESGEKVRLTTSGVDLADLVDHDVTISYEDDTLALWLDGTMHASHAMDAPLANVGRHDLVFGNQWGKANFESVIDAFDITLGEISPDLMDEDTSVVGVPAAWDPFL